MNIICSLVFGFASLSPKIRNISKEHAKGKGYTHPTGNFLNSSRFSTATGRGASHAGLRALRLGWEFCCEPSPMLFLFFPPAPAFAFALGPPSAFGLGSPFAFAFARPFAFGFGASGADPEEGSPTAFAFGFLFLGSGLSAAHC